MLLWLSLAIAVAASVSYYASLDALPFNDFSLHVLGYALTALLLAGIAARNPWARILFALLLGWKFALAAINLAAASAQLPLLYSLDQLVLGLQLAGTLLLFTPSGNTWFRPHGADA